MSTTTTDTVAVPNAGEAQLRVTAYGDGHPILLLHGGAGPQSVAELARALADRERARVLTPTHPGFAGTPRPEWLDGIAALAALYRRLLDQLGLTDVIVVGNSVGGWIAAELALLASPRISRIVLVDAVGIEVPASPSPTSSRSPPTRSPTSATTTPSRSASTRPASATSSVPPWPPTSPPCGPTGAT